MALLRARHHHRAGALPRAQPGHFHLRGHLERRRFLAAPAVSRRSHREAGECGADLLINIAASPFTVEKRHLRPRMLASCGAALAAPAGVREPGGRPGRSGVRRFVAGGRTPRARSSRAPPSTRPILSSSTSMPAAARCGPSPNRTRARRWMRWCWARATTPVAAASPARSSGFRAASIRRWWRASPAARSIRPRCWAWPCRRAIRRITRAATPPTWPRTWASNFARSPSSPCSRPTSMRWRRPSPVASPT
jgi:hypothetical protein